LSGLGAFSAPDPDFHLNFLGFFRDIYRTAVILTSCEAHGISFSGVLKNFAKIR